MSLDVAAGMAETEAALRPVIEELGGVDVSRLIEETQRHCALGWCISPWLAAGRC